MTRRALLISNPGEEAEKGTEKYCEGVFVDVAKYKAFFQEPQGGWWDESEIIHFNRPSVREVRAAISGLSYYDYSFVAFSGHGWYSSVENATVLTLRKGEELPYHDLLKDSNKRTLILDCCRKVYNEPIMKMYSEKRALAEALQRRTPDPRRCRDEFFRIVSSVSREVVVAYGCTTGEKAGDDPTQGGRYTASLLASAARWSDGMARERSGTGSGSLSIVAAHNNAAEITIQRSGGTQNPHIEKSRSEPYFPFAVFVE